MFQKVVSGDTIPPTAAVEAELARHGEEGKLLRRLLRIAKDRDALQAGQPLAVEEIPGDAEEMSRVYPAVEVPPVAVDPAEDVSAPL